MPALGAARVITPDRVLEPGAVELEGDRIVAVTPTKPPVPNRTLVPGFVDLQVNGHQDVDVAHAEGADWDRLDALLAAQGVTSWCPTLVSAPLEDYDDALARIAAAARRSGTRPAIAGAHLEGPFLAVPGAHRPELLRAVDLAWLSSLPEVVRVVTMAPELAGAARAVADLTARGVLVGLGHTRATLEEVAVAVDAGARLVTHCFNAMSPLHHRSPGPVGGALTDDRVAVSLIGDLVHVHPAVVSIAFRTKRAGGVALVTDASARHGAGPPRLPDGTLAGSALTMDQAVRNVVAHCGVPLVDAVRAASATPAGLLGLADRGRLAPGCRADLVALGPDLEVQATWVGGQQLWP